MRAVAGDACCAPVAARLRSRRERSLARRLVVLMDILPPWFSGLSADCAPNKPKSIVSPAFAMSRHFFAPNFRLYCRALEWYFAWLILDRRGITAAANAYSGIGVALLSPLA